jgi:hypothetical protein
MTDDPRNGLDTPGPEGHPLDDLPGLIAGELDLARANAVVRHLRTCDECRNELLDVLHGSSALRLLASTSDPEAEIDLSDPTVGQADLPPLSAASASGPRRRGRWLVAAVTVVALLLGGAVVGVVANRDRHPNAASVELRPVGDSSGSGTVSMSGTGDNLRMTVDTTLAPPAEGTFYEVWLLQQKTGQMISVGVLPDGGAASFVLPGDIVSAYDAVDISVQPDNGDPAHSADSVLRASYAT